MMTPEAKCNICTCEFDIEAEGGIEGYIGIIPFSLCPMCYSGLMDMYDQLIGDYRDEQDGPSMAGDDEE